MYKCGSVSVGVCIWDETECRCCMNKSVCICVCACMYGCETLSVGVLYECVSAYLCVCLYGCETECKEVV